MSTPTNIPETPTGETKQDSFFESKEKFQQQLQDIFQTFLRLTGPDHFDQLCQWMEYKQYCTIDDFYESSYDDLENFDNKGPATEYKWKGKTNHLSPIVAQKLKCFIKWMTHEDRPYELHDNFLATLTRDSYLNFRHMDTQSFSASSLSHHEPSKLKTSIPGEFKSQTTSESQTALNNFKKGTKRDASVYPIFKNDKYYDTFQRSFLASLKAQGLYDVADPEHDPENGDIYEKELFKGKQSFVFSVLVTSLQTEKGRELVKEFEGDARSIISKLHHYHTKSNVAQHDIITLTTDITNLTLNDSWKGTVRQFLNHSRRNSDCLTALSLFLINFLKLPESHFSRELSNKTMTSDRYMSWTLCGDSKLTQQMPLPLIPTTTSFGMQHISMISIKSRKDLRDRHSSPNKKKSVMMMNMPMQKSNFPLIQNQRNILHIQFISHHFTPRCHKSPSSLVTSGRHFLRALNR